MKWKGQSYFFSTKINEPTKMETSYMRQSHTEAGVSQASSLPVKKACQ